MRNMTMLVAFLLLFGILVAADVLSPYQYDKQTVKYMVESGDTVWDIAERYMDKQDKVRDVREMVWAIKQESGKDTCLVHRGEVLSIPLYKRK